MSFVSHPSEKFTYILLTFRYVHPCAYCLNTGSEKFGSLCFGTREVSFLKRFLSGPGFFFPTGFGLGEVFDATEVMLPNTNLCTTCKSFTRLFSKKELLLFWGERVHQIKTWKWQPWNCAS